jgi:hypothetical protein
MAPVLRQATLQMFVDLDAALIKANLVYKDKAEAVAIAVRYTKRDPEAVSPTYDFLANAGAWPVNDGLPKDMVEWTINRPIEIGPIKAAEKPSYDKRVDISVINAAIKKADGRLSGDKRWD